MPFWWYQLFPPVFEKHLTILFYGPRSSGKSLHQAKTAVGIFKYLDRLYSIHTNLPQAIVLSNQLFKESINKAYLGERLFYWENIQQLRYCPRPNCWKIGKTDDNGVPISSKHRLHDAYIIFDDIATIIPADGWADLPKWFRKLFAQAGHNGIHCIANIQDPVSCDINFRRYVDVAIKFNKIMGNRRPEEAKPEVRFIWGFYTMRSVSAEELYKNGDLTEQEIQRLEELHPELMGDNWKSSLGWIGRKATEIYNTRQNVPEYMPNSLDEQVLTCVHGEDCKDKDKHGKPFQIIRHKPI